MCIGNKQARITADINYVYIQVRVYPSEIGCNRAPVFFTLISGNSSHSRNMSIAGNAFDFKASWRGSRSLTGGGGGGGGVLWVVWWLGRCSLESPSPSFSISPSTHDTFKKLSFGTAENSCAELNYFKLSLGWSVVQTINNTGPKQNILLQILCVLLLA
jgi:hypothetical protein